MIVCAGALCVFVFVFGFWVVLYLKIDEKSKKGGLFKVSSLFLHKFLSRFRLSFPAVVSGCPFPAAYTYTRRRSLRKTHILLDLRKGFLMLSPALEQHQKQVDFEHRHIFQKIVPKIVETSM